MTSPKPGRCSHDSTRGCAGRAIHPPTSEETSTRSSASFTAKVKLFFKRNALLLKPVSNGPGILKGTRKYLEHRSIIGDCGIRMLL